MSSWGEYLHKMTFSNLGARTYPEISLGTKSKSMDATVPKPDNYVVECPFCWLTFLGFALTFWGAGNYLRNPKP